MTRVLIADDHALFRAGLRQFLVEALPSAEIGEAASGNEVLTCLQRKGWDLLILDINMPDRSGLDILRHVKSGHPGHARPGAVGLSGAPIRAERAAGGRRGLHREGRRPGGSAQGRAHGAAGPSVRQRKPGGTAAARPGPRGQAVARLLSDREFQIFGKLAAGHGVSEIGRELCLSVKTVSTYRTRILEKMRMKSNADLTSYALRNEIIQ